ncbi:MAG TPA: sigma-70 family RNA polymerase sigma factor [Kofleriaceae bacterium]|jgi:RNA polymerase sigma-70 factor (ECF subfamily)|nr:sigma-70 family RNA polymerase sigma factor [Kofleriaceae bacterium]
MDPVDHLIATAGLAAPSRADVATAWQALLDAARAAWPDVRIDVEHIVAFVAERLAGEGLAAALAAAPAADLVLAAACAADEPTALAAFDSVLTEVDAAGASTRSPRDLVDDVKQLIRVQLLVAKDGKPPGITGYRGKGPLRGWVRITATRELIRHQRKRARELPAGMPTAAMIERPLDEAIGDAGDPLLSELKAEYRTEFASALREAITELSAEDRTLLRQQIVDQLSIDEIGAAFGVHRATAARWLQRARAALVTATRDRLAARLKVSVDDIDSVIRLVQSQLDASVVRYLREGEDVTDDDGS